MSRDLSNDDSVRPDDTVLLSRVRAGDATAFEALFHAYYALLCSVANQYVHSPDEAKDIAQQVLFVLWRDRTTFHVRGSLKDYLCASARNGALNLIAHRRVVQIHHEVVQRDPGAGVSADDAHNHLEADERHARIARQLADLPPRQRAICTLRWIDGLSYVEIAQRLGISEKTIANQLTRALQTIRTALTEQ